MRNFTTFTKLFEKLEHTVFSICDSHLITGDHRILIGHNTFNLWATRASSRDVTAIKKQSKYFCLRASGLLVIKTHSSESRGQEEVVCTRVFRPTQPLQ